MGVGPEPAVRVEVRREDQRGLGHARQQAANRVVHDSDPDSVPSSKTLLPARSLMEKCT